MGQVILVHVLNANKNQQQNPKPQCFYKQHSDFSVTRVFTETSVVGYTSYTYFYPINYSISVVKKPKPK